MVAEWDCIVRNLLRVADGRVDPRVKIEDVRDGGGESRYFRRLVLLADETLREIHEYVMATRSRDCLEIGTGYGATTW